MRFAITTPSRTAVVRRGVAVSVAPNGTSWSEQSLGDARSEVGVYVIHHNGEVKYVGKTSGRKMNFGIRLRRHFQERAASAHTYPRLAAIRTPPEIKVSLYDLQEIRTFVSYSGMGRATDRNNTIQLFEAALIISLRPEFQQPADEP